MKENSQSEKSLIKCRDGESSVLIVLIFTVIIVFLILPIFAFIFDKAVLNLVSQDIVDEVQLLTLKIYPSFSQSELSETRIEVANDLKDKINGELSLLEIHPMIEWIQVTDTKLLKKEFYIVEFSIELSLKPSMYRDVIVVPLKYDLNYTIVLPINK